MSYKLMFAAGLTAVLLAGCTQNIRPTDVDRAVIGAGTGYVVQKVAGKDNSDRLAGAAIGAAGGALCDDVGLCQ